METLRGGLGDTLRARQDGYLPGPWMVEVPDPLMLYLLSWSSTLTASRSHVGWQGGLAMFVTYTAVFVAAYMMFGPGRSLVSSPPDERNYEDGRIASSLQEGFIEDDEERGEGGVKSPV